LAAYVALLVLSYSVNVLPGFLDDVMLLVVVGTTTVTAALVFIETGRCVEKLSDHHVRVARNFAIMFAIACAAAWPMFALDFWYYLATGRFAASGGNVYLTPLPPAAYSGIQIYDEEKLITMTYGPGWVWVGRLISGAVGSHVAREFVAYKALMLTAWMTVLHLISYALRSFPLLQIRALVLLGWLPFPLMASLVEGHNDIVMVALMTPWLVGLGAWSVWSLAASVLIKYATAPLMVLAGVDALVRRRRTTLGMLVAATTVVAAVVWKYWQRGALLSGWLNHPDLFGFTPVFLVEWVFRIWGGPPWIGPLVIGAWRLVLVGVALWYGRRYWRAPSQRSLCAWIVTVFLIPLLGSRYMWPWYSLWILPALVIAADSFLLKLAVPLYVVLPFVQILMHSEVVRGAGKITFVFYASVGLCWVLAFGSSRLSGYFRRHLEPRTP
jgi:hypothetical protein